MPEPKGFTITGGIVCRRTTAQEMEVHKTNIGLMNSTEADSNVVWEMMAMGDTVFYCPESQEMIYLAYNRDDWHHHQVTDYETTFAWLLRSTRPSMQSQAGI